MHLTLWPGRGQMRRLRLTPATAGTIRSMKGKTERAFEAKTDSCMNRRAITLSVAVLLAAALVPTAQAQRQFAFARTSGTRAAPPFSQRGVRGRGFARHHRARRFPGSFYAPYFYPDYDYGYDSELQTIEAPPPQIVEQVAQPAAPAPVSPPLDSVVIELQGDHWVRVTNYGQSQTDGPSSQAETDRASNPQTGVPRRVQAPESITEVPAAVLVFRDGRREEIGKYVVVGSTLYAGADYWSSGSWTRKVQLRDLDVPATLKLNQERDAKFTLPSAPNEVMIRP